MAVNAQTVRIVLAIVMLVVFIVQLIALLSRDGYVDSSSDGRYWYSTGNNRMWWEGFSCGIIWCSGGSTYRGEGSIGKYVSGACAFAITAMIFIVFKWVLHTLLCFKSCALRITESVWMARYIDYIWISHALVAVMNLFAALLLGIGKDRHLPDRYSLQYSFYLLIVIAALECCVAVATWRRMHIADYGIVVLPSDAEKTTTTYVTTTPARSSVRMNPIDDPTTWSSPRKY